MRLPTSHCRQFKINHRVVEFKTGIESINDFVTANLLFKQFINQICIDYIDILESKTKVKFTLEHNSFQYPVQFPFIYKEDLTPELIWMRLETIIQSRKNDLNYTTHDNVKIDNYFENR